MLIDGTTHPEINEPYTRFIIETKVGELATEGSLYVRLMLQGGSYND